MGNSSSKYNGIYNQSTKNEDRKENETHVYRNPKNMNLEPCTDKNTIQEYVEELFKSKKPEDPLYHSRVRNDEGELTSETSSISYGEFRKASEIFGKGVLDLDLCPWREEFRDYKMRFMGIYAGNSYNYMVQEMACIMFNIVSVPIYNTLGEEATIYAFTNTRMSTLCLTASHVEKMIDQKRQGNLPDLKTLILLDDENFKKDFKTSAKEVDLKFYKWSDVLVKGGQSSNYNWEPVTTDDIYCFSYTSGTTGTPKGAMLSNQNIAKMIPVLVKHMDLKPSDFHLNYLPMAHIFERLMSLMALVTGVQIGLFSGDIRKLKDDLGIFKPTIFVSVPRLYNKFFDAIQTNIKKTEGTLKGTLIQKAISTKLKNLEKYGTVTHTLYDALVFKKMKAILGGRVRMMLTASAPLDKDVADFMKICMCCPMTEAYGQTEGTGGEFCMAAEDTSSGHVGGVLPHGEFKLVDVPEMKYTNKDIDPESGLNAPRGEIWYRGECVIPGYYKNELKNVDSFSPEGWLMSGDIGIIKPPNNRLVIIDRKKNIFKLSQGEYIAPEKLEGAYKTCTPLITDIFVYGNSFKSCVVAVLTVEKANQRAFANLMKVCSDVPDEDLLSHPDFEKGIILMFKTKAKEVKFNGLEVPKGLVFNEVPFAEMGLLTTSFKQKRNDIKDHFLENFEKRYESLF